MQWSINGKMTKKTNNDQQNTTQKAKDWTTWLH